MKALSVKQPWAWTIIHAGKNIENRTWHTDYRGPLLIHAGKYRPSRRENEVCREIVEAASPQIDWPAGRKLRQLYGGIIGRVDLVDCIWVGHPGAAEYIDWPWAYGPCLWILRNPEPLEFTTEWGRLGIFEVSGRVMRKVRRQVGE